MSTESLSALSLRKENVISVLTSADGHSYMGCMGPNPRPSGGHSRKSPVIPKQTPRVSLKHRLRWEPVSPIPPSSDFNIYTTSAHCLRDISRNSRPSHEAEKSVSRSPIPHFLPLFLLSTPQKHLPVTEDLIVCFDLLFQLVKCRQTPQFPLPCPNERNPGSALCIREVLTEYVCTLDVFVVWRL